MQERSDEIRQLHAEIEELKARVTALESGGKSTISPLISEGRSSTESGLGLKTVNRIGALTLAIGIIFFFKYAADNEWIGPGARVLIGIAAGILLLGAAQWLERRDARIFGQGIAGCGFAAIGISLYAAYAYYHLIGIAIALVLLFGVSALAVYISIHDSNPTISLIGFGSALLTPGVLRLTWREFDFSYICIASVLFAVSAIRRARLVANYAYVIAHLCLSVVALDEITRRIQPDSLAKTIASVMLAVYGIALLSLGIARGSLLNRGLGLFFLGLVVAKLYLYDVWQLQYASRITAFVALGILLLAASYIYSRWKARPGT